MMKWIDMPPVWLAGAIGLVWAVDQALPLPGFGVLGFFGPSLVVLGLGLMSVALAQMVWRRTTFIPKAQPTALVTGGVFSLSRNPIYLGDALILAGLILTWDVPLALPVLPVFLWVITTRFIRDEEARLRAGFGAAFDAWAVRTGRWGPKV